MELRWLRCTNSEFLASNTTSILGFLNRWNSPETRVFPNIPCATESVGTSGSLEGRDPVEASQHGNMQASMQRLIRRHFSSWRGNLSCDTPAMSYLIPPHALHATRVPEGRLPGQHAWPGHRSAILITVPLLKLHSKFKTVAAPEI